MGDLRDPRLMYLKAALFIVIGVAASTVILIEHPTVTTAVCLMLAVWACCRVYYFAF